VNTTFAPSLAKRTAVSRADAGGAAGDEGDFVFEIFGHAISYLKNLRCEL